MKQEVTASPPKSLANGDLKVNGTNVSETVSPSPLSPSESVKSPDSQSFGKSKAVHATSEKHTRVRTTSTSGPEVIRKSLKDLQRSSVSIARFQSMLDDVSSSYLYAQSNQLQGTNFSKASLINGLWQVAKINFSNFQISKEICPRSLLLYAMLLCLFSIKIYWGFL